VVSSLSWAKAHSSNRRVTVSSGTLLLCHSDGSRVRACVSVRVHACMRVCVSE